MEPVVVEVKGIIKQGLSLFGYMMKTVDRLEANQSLIVKSTFNPAPLISHMRRKGYGIQQEKIGKMTITTFVPGQSTPLAKSSHSAQSVVPIEGPEHFLDNRGLTPPEPMQRTLELLEEVPEGHVVVIHNDRVPIFLLGKLDDDDIPYQIEARADDSAIVRILKNPRTFR